MIFSDQIGKIWNLNDLVLGRERQPQFDKLKEDYKKSLKAALYLKFVFEHISEIKNQVDIAFVLCKAQIEFGKQPLQDARSLKEVIDKILSAVLMRLFMNYIDKADMKEKKMRLESQDSMRLLLSLSKASLPQDHYLFSILKKTVQPTCKRILHMHESKKIVNYDKYEHDANIWLKNVVYNE